MIILFLKCSKSNEAISWMSTICSSWRTLTDEDERFCMSARDKFCSVGSRVGGSCVLRFEKKDTRRPSTASALRVTSGGNGHEDCNVEGGEEGVANMLVVEQQSPTAWSSCVQYCDIIGSRNSLLVGGGGKGPVGACSNPLLVGVSTKLLQ
mmetsp:Transcript_22170/g.32192  ORF Transcript_22170/g.32192 Transcript_22170/m.32192 type:complete len:151 (-) Transcript_22170:523-975(-)